MEFTPIKRSRNNTVSTPSSTPSLTLSNYSSPKKIKINKLPLNILSLNKSYTSYLFAKIPVLNEDFRKLQTPPEIGSLRMIPGENLLKLIITYSNSQNEIEKKESLQNITKELRKKYNLNNIGPFNNLNNKVSMKNNKVIKSYVFRAHGLIEGVIHATLCYLTQGAFKYVPSVNIIKKLNTNNNNKNRLYEVMNIAPGLSLEHYIINLFNSNEDNKKQLMIYVLIKIAQNLLQLQNICGFIHGDLNEQNIFINQSDGSVLFIDFGRSICRIPTSNGSYAILSTPVDENLSYKYTLDINKDYRLKGIDLFYLIEKLSRFRSGSFNNFDQFLSIINQIKGNMKVNQRMELFKVIYTDEFLSNQNLENFYPENFMNNLNFLLRQLQLNQ